MAYVSRAARSISYNVNSTDPTTIENISALLGGVPSESGERVNTVSVAGIPAYMGCVSLLARLTSMVPCPTYKRDREDGRSKDRETSSYDLLNSKANPYLNSDQFRQHLVVQCLNYGRGLGYITRDPDTYEPVELDKIDQTDTQVSPIVEIVGGVSERIIAYVCRKNAQQAVTLAAEDVIDIPMISIGGTCGHSFIQQLRQTLGLAIAEQKWGAMYFKNGSHVTKLLKVPTWLSAEQKLEVRQDLQDLYSGTRNAHKTFLLQNGLELDSLATNNEQSQWVEGMQQSGIDIATALNLPGACVNSKLGSSYNSLEQENLALLRTLEMWFSTLEYEYNNKLLRESQRRNRYIEHERLSALDPITVNTLLDKQVASTRLSLEEARVRSNLPVSMKGTFLVGSGVQTLEQLLKPPAPVQAPPAQDQNPNNQNPSEQPPPDATVARSLVAGIVGRFKTRLVRAAEQPRFNFVEHRSVLEDQLEPIEQDTVREALDSLAQELAAVLPEQRMEAIRKWNPNIC